MSNEQADMELFARLFAEEDLTPQKIYDRLDDDQFEWFVKYVFEQAGYTVVYSAHTRGPGLDLKIYVDSLGGQTFHAGVQVKHFQPDVTKVQVAHIRDLRGGLPESSDVTGYFVTTSTFNDPALTEASRGRKIWPIDGDHLVRYIIYVRGTRSQAMDDADPDQWLRSAPLAPIPPEVFFTADTIMRRPANETTVLTVANNKGGVGKTTSALNIALGLAAQDRQVLLVDLDAQANLTRALPPPVPDGKPLYIGDYFTHKRPLVDLIRPTMFKRVWLIPSDSELNRADMGISAGTEVRFQRDLHATDILPPHVLDTRPFDWIILDTGPHMGVFTRSALGASHAVLVPISPSAFADQGTALLISTVLTMAALTNRSLTVLGFLVTQWRDDATNRDLLAKFTARIESSGLRLFKTKVTYDKPNIEKAHLDTGQGRRRNIFDRRSAAAQAYLDVVDEVLHHEYS